MKGQIDGALALHWLMFRLVEIGCGVEKALRGTPRFGMMEESWGAMGVNLLVPKATGWLQVGTGLINVGTLKMGGLGFAET